MVLTSGIIISRITGPFEKLWRGNYSLPVAFWAWFILGSFLAPFVAMIVSVPFYLAEVPLAEMPQLKLPLFVVAMIVYPIFAAVGVWRSANARPFEKWPVAAAAAKIGVCFWLLGSASRVTGMGFMDVVRLLGTG
jgi:hypothetical protein